MASLSLAVWPTETAREPLGWAPYVRDREPVCSFSGGGFDVERAVLG
jgi:hypothetical protein